jgi:hypothetical protein
MSSVLEHRREYLRLMRQFTIDRGFFTITDIQHAANIPRSTAQDWINRLLIEGCVFQKEEKHGRNPAQYAAISAMPTSTCRKIFTTVDGDDVAIYHDCMSGACAAFCGHHHVLAGGVVRNAHRDGTLLHEVVRIGSSNITVGLSPLPAVGVHRVERDQDMIVQYIRCIGGPAYSLSDMMARAEGVLDVESRHEGMIVEGKVWTKALTHLTIGIDDTDSPEGGATFALALAMLNHIARIGGILPISHHVAMLYPDIPGKTAGNSASFIEIGVLPGLEEDLVQRVLRFVSDEALSPEWGIAVRKGLTVPEKLRDYGRAVRMRVVIRPEAEFIADSFGISLFGGNGVIGALGALALTGLPHEVLLDPSQAIL